MPRRAKGARLYLKSRGGREAVWVIRDGNFERSTGFPEQELGSAEKSLARYIAEKGAPPPEPKHDPVLIAVREVLTYYAAKRVPKLKSDPASNAGFIAHLDAFWGDRPLTEVKRSTCEAYAAHREGQGIRHGNTDRKVSDQTARRELETLSAAIGFWDEEFKLVGGKPTVWLPPKAESPRDAMSRAQAAALLKAARGYRKVPAYGCVRPREPWPMAWIRLSSSARKNRAHVCRFILLGLYTGTRHSAMTALLWHESATQAWVDLGAGCVYRKGKRERDARNKKRPMVVVPDRLLGHLRRWARIDAERAAEAAKRQHNQPPGVVLYNSVLHHGGFPIAGKIRRGFAGCVRDAGLPEEITPHWMRHTCATWLMQQSCDMWEAAGYTGMTVAVLEKHYAHHRPDHQARARKALNGKR